ncbi:hypothetical protein BJ508DRAFT_44872 [Ascobolus immersus RN42]|uniref:Metallo-beta-lactamase domain-containing protein n=1 Tax=Ascobolus immersus RN42 TaxID=1160509 RepID=A0A3N4HPA9_ASCIM|nr:hypothetical protein BJ508DRAFT_44872 [Ascobolus immersus RN42]
MKIQTSFYKYGPSSPHTSIFHPFTDLHSTTYIHNMHVHVHPINLDGSLLVSILPDATSSKPLFTFAVDPWLGESIHALHPIIWKIQHTAPLLIESLTQLPEIPSAIFLTSHLADHCSKPSLIDLPPSTPIYGPPAAIALVRSWNHFTDLHTYVHFSTENPTEATRIPLPGDYGTIEIVRLPAKYWYAQPHVHSFLSIRVIPTKTDTPPWHMIWAAHPPSPSILMPYLDHLWSVEKKKAGSSKVEATLVPRPSINVLMWTLQSLGLPKLLGGNLVPGLVGLEALMKVLNENNVKVERLIDIHDEDKKHTGWMGQFCQVLMADRSLSSVGGVDMWRVKEGGWKWEIDGGGWRGGEMSSWGCCAPREGQLGMRELKV